MKLSLESTRALWGEDARPTRPESASSVCEALSPGVPGLTLRLRAHRKTSLYEAWLWEGNDGQAYLSRRERSQKTSARKMNATIERALQANKRMEIIEL